MRRIVLGALAVVVAGLLVVQLVPYGRAHGNPPVTGEPAWDSPATRATAVAACFDCHSNETVWPWYSNIAPLSWRIQKHVDDGREKLNFSEWGTRDQEVDEIAQVVEEGEMPPWDYLILHPEARLSDADRATFVDGLRRTFGGGSGDGERGGDDD